MRDWVVEALFSGLTSCSVSGVWRRASLRTGFSFLFFVSFCGWESVQKGTLLSSYSVSSSADFALTSATIPIYASECSPAKIRGGLVIMCQM
jgi:hypothetical protein